MTTAIPFLVGGRIACVLILPLAAQLIASPTEAACFEPPYSVSVHYRCNKWRRRQQSLVEPSRYAEIRTNTADETVV